MSVELSWLVRLERFAEIQKVGGGQGGREGFLECRDGCVRLFRNDLEVGLPCLDFLFADRPSPGTAQETAQYALNRLRIGQLLAFVNDSSMERGRPGRVVVTDELDGLDDDSWKIRGPRGRP